MTKRTKNTAHWYILAMIGVILSIPGARAQTPTGATTEPDAEGGPTVRDSTVGYIDSAVPISQFRFRWDQAFNNNRPTRAEYFYPRGAPQGGPGLPLPETNINFQDLTGYLEVAGSQRWSVFVEAPVRILHPQVNQDATGFADMNAGFKVVMLEGEQWLLTGQLRSYLPTGQADRGLGTHHVSLEPALLFNYRVADWLSLEGEFRFWAPIGGTDFAGDILRYGVGVAVGQRQPDRFWATPVVEFVGWTVLNGLESAGAAVLSAQGDTIVNMKAGVRFGVGERADFYAGYGRALTGDVWYQDIVRLEFRYRF